MAAPKKAPIVWKRKYTGNFLQRSLPSRHRANVTAGFRWPPVNIVDSVLVHNKGEKWMLFVLNADPVTLNYLRIWMLKKKSHVFKTKPNDITSVLSFITSPIKGCLPDTWPQTRMPRVAAKPKAKLTVRNMPWEPPLNTSCATAPQPNIWRQSRKAS